MYRMVVISNYLIKKVEFYVDITKKNCIFVAIWFFYINSILLYFLGDENFELI